jgi:sigma-B regulation protein RsbU (phosphoserine phosphatase)
MNAELFRRWLLFGQFVSGVLIFTTGLLQCAFSRPFDRRRNRALLALGIAGVLYGVRLLGVQPEVRALIGASPRSWAFVDAYVTYVLLVPILYFFELTFGTGWHNGIRWWRVVATVYAVAAMLIDGFTNTPTKAKGPNGYLVVTTIILLVANSLRRRAPDFSGIRIVRAGLLVFGAFVLFENIVNDRLLYGAWNVEWAGVLVLLACLGSVAVSRALENDRRLHELSHELEMARQIQASIVPRRMPRVEGVDLAARYLPMTAVAGDFYDFLELGAGRVGVLVADVSGHGMPAALIASMVKVALVAQSMNAEEPARLLEGLNQIFCGRLDRQFITAAYVYIDAINGRLRYGAAGHPPALLVRETGRLEELAENGIMLGQFPEWTYSSVESTFEAGDRLILYTDGLIEATDDRGTFFDSERLRTFAQSGSAHDADAFVAALVDHVRDWRGRAMSHGFEDDITVVVVDRLPLS